MLAELSSAGKIKPGNFRSSLSAFGEQLDMSWTELVVGLVFLYGIHLTAGSHFLLFHSVAELFSVVIAATAFLIAITCWRSITHPYVSFVGIAYGFVAILDVLHALSYPGMTVLTDYDYYAPQFWIASRYMEAASMLIGLSFLGSRARLSLPLQLTAFSALTSGVIVSILHLKNFPVCFVAGQGLTPFKVVSEYIICLMLVSSIVLLHRRHGFFDRRVYRLIQSALFLTILTELCFTLYVSDAMNDVFNEAGHLLKIASFYMIYKAVIVTGLRDPVQLLFRDLKRNEARLLEAQHLASLGSWEWTADNRAWEATAEVLRFFGLPASARLRLESMLTALAPNDRQSLLAAIRQAWKESRAIDLMIRIERRSGEAGIAQIRGEVFRDPRGKVVRLAGTLQDVTAQQRLLNELKLARDDAELANRAKSRFLAAASHDLRQPLSALSIYVGGLEGTKAKPNKKLVSNMKACVASLNAMLTNLLDISKLDAGAVTKTISDFSLDAIIARVLSSQTPNAELKGLQLRNACFGVFARTDPVLFYRIVENLVSNAIRYTERGGVLIGCRRFQGKTWLEIWDTGIGIPENMIEVIFEEFRRLDDGQGGPENGNGLGLAIVSKTAQLLGLQIRVKSRPGRGSMFAIELPPGEAVSSAPRSLHAYRSLRIALVEDNSDVATSILYAMTKCGHTVVSAASGRALLPLLAGIRPDVLISDYRLGDGETGCDVIASVRAAFGHDLPALIITGDTDPEVIRKVASERIMVQYKPLDIDELRAAVAELTG